MRWVAGRLLCDDRRLLGVNGMEDPTGKFAQ